MTTTEAKKTFVYNYRGGDNIILYGYKGYSKVLKIPGKIGKHSVIALDKNERSNYDFSDIDEIFLPEGLVSIFSKVFAGTCLKKVYFPSTIQYIAHNCFAATQLEDVELPVGLRSLGDYAFNSTKIKCLKTSILGEYAFFNNTYLEKAELQGCKCIPKGCFKECDSLKTLLFNESLEEIDRYAFSGCNGLKVLVLPKSIKSIGDYAFEKCFKLEKIFLPDTIESIGVAAIPKYTRIDFY